MQSEYLPIWRKSLRNMSCKEPETSAVPKEHAGEILKKVCRIIFIRKTQTQFSTYGKDTVSK